MKTARTFVQIPRSAAPALVIALLVAGNFVLGARASQAQALWGSSSKGGTNPSSVFTVDAATGAAALVGPSGLGDGISAIRFDPVSGMLYGMFGSACTGARLITIDTATGAGTFVGTLSGAGFDGGTGVPCAGGSDALAFASDGTLYAGGLSLSAGTQLFRVDKATGAVLEAHPTADHMSGLAFDPAGVLWASHGNSLFIPALHTIDPATGGYTSTLVLAEPVVVSDLAFAADGTLYVSLPAENRLATVDPATGAVTRIGSFGSSAGKISGLAVAPPPSNKLSALAPVLWIGLKNSNVGGAGFDLRVELTRNGELLASGIARCVPGLNRTPSPVEVPFDAFPAVSVKSGDVFCLKVSSRMGTNPDNTLCSMPDTSAVGMRLHYDSTSHASKLDVTITPAPAESFFLHSDGGACSTPGQASSGVTKRFLDGTAPAAASDKCKDSPSGNPGSVNPWKEIGSWSMTRP